MRRSLTQDRVRASLQVPWSYSRAMPGERSLGAMPWKNSEQASLGEGLDCRDLSDVGVPRE